MSLISDVKYEIDKINYSERSIKQFRILFISLALILFFLFNYNEVKQLSFISIQYSDIKNIILYVVFVFFVVGTNQILKTVYKYWMAFSFLLGWVVSRIILSVLFFLVLTPTSIIAKIFNKNFFDVNISETSTWLKHNDNSDYTKMY